LELKTLEKTKGQRLPFVCPAAQRFNDRRIRKRDADCWNHRCNPPTLVDADLVSTVDDPPGQTYFRQLRQARRVAAKALLLD
jgi:hypothetical protein